MRSSKIVSLLFLLFATTAVAGEHDRYFGAGWKWNAVEREEITLGEDADYPCHIKAYGWRLVSSRREGGVLGLFGGTVYKKWAYKMIVAPNPEHEAVLLGRFRMELRDREGVMLDHDLSPLGSGPLYVDVRLERGDERVLQGRREYNASEPSAQGDPDHVSWDLRCEPE